jgi:DNA-binding IclR family transcriptional regulator
MKIIQRTVNILDHLSANGGRMRFSDLSEAMRLASPSTLVRLLKALCDADVIYRDSKGFYSLSAKTRAWGGASLPRLTLKEMVRPELELINEKFQVSTIVFRDAEDGKVLCVDKVSDENSPSLQSPGALLPLSFGIIGSVFLRREQNVADADFMSPFPESDFYREVHKRMVLDSQRLAYVYDFGKLFPDNHRAAAPFYHDGRVIGVIGAGFLSVRAKEKKFVERVGAALIESAARITKLISEQHGEFK